MPDDLEYNDNLPYFDENVGDIDDFENELGDVPELSDKQKQQFKNRYGRRSFLDKLKRTWKGKNKVGKYLGLGLDIGESFLPGWTGRIRDIIQNKTQPKNDSKMNWLLNRLQERSTWRGIITALTAVGAGLSPDQAQAIIGLGVSLFVAIEVFMKEPQSKDAK